MMKQHAVATYLQLVAGCDRVLYDAEWWGLREPPIDLIGVKGETTAIAVDIADKFKAYPKGMRLGTWKRKLTQRFTFIHERFRSWNIEKPHAEVWFFDSPVEALEITLPSVIQTLWRERQFPIEVIPAGEVQRRIAQAVEAVKAHGKDIGNPFAQAILLSSGMLSTPPKEAALPPTQLSLELPDAYAIPTFVKAFFESGYFAHWLGFDAPIFSVLWELAQKRRSSAWAELEQLLSSTEVFSWDRWEAEGGWAVTPKYSLEQVVGVLRWVVQNAARLLEAWHERWQTHREPFVVEVTFLLPYIARHPFFLPEVIEAEIVRYGGDRDLVRAYSGFQNPRPSKRFYRGYLRLVLQGPYDLAPRPPKLPAIEVPLRNPFLPRGTTVSLSLLYPPEFAGYFLLTFETVAKTVRPLVERFRRA